MSHLAVEEVAEAKARDRSPPAGWKKIAAALSRLLTISRVVGLVPFLWLLLEAGENPSPKAEVILPGLYLVLALSDFFDGRLARLAGAASPLWAKLDVGADILFNFSSLAAAASLGLISPWVPAGIALLGGRFLWRIGRRQPDPVGRLSEDRAGKLAGVIYYLLVGWVVLEVSSGGSFAGHALDRAGDVVFLYTIAVLARGGSPGAAR